MKFDPRRHHRPFDPAQGRCSVRLQGYDYTLSGAYYVTIVTYQRQHLFGEVVNGVMQLNELGQIARDEWFKTALLRPYVALLEDEFVVTPNHAHGIIWIDNAGGDDFVAVPPEQFGEPVPHSVPTVVRAYKSAVTYAINALQKQPGAVLWQRNYYEHVIRDEKDLQAKRDYILSNPLNWEDDDANK